MKQENIEHAKFRAQAQIFIDKDKGIEAFEEYMKIAFPYLEATKKRTQEQALAVLNKEIGRGPLAVRAIPQPSVRSKLKTKLEQRAQPQTRQEADNLYSRIGSSMPYR